ncbi:hypothetical protein H261_19641 [Paramagnetospirillum caucaseum]|uniref:2-hydroxylaminobenzoate mutase n=1 Tax=Paramagnetospirillum caucaseum TaxID=1244869 RepID=M2ZLR3_9PROT|nr:DUF4863 family protein [Paramagnetospirillum caucaseum]EME68207.1 hypothetical protein H261_19641 [Paramagnetospirillum caucaseum]
MSKTAFKALVAQVTSSIAGLPVDETLAGVLGARFPADGAVFKSIEAACHAGIAEGWMCENEHGGIRYGRVAEADGQLSDFSIDVVHMKDVVGPRHRHPLGEIDMIMPIDPDAKFDGAPRGWLVYGPDSAHRPTLTEGAALVLYLLPGGQIDFSRPK